MLRPMSARSNPFASRSVSSLLRVANAAKSERARAVFARRHQQQLSMLIELVRLREIPHRSLRLVIASAAQNSATRVIVDVFVGPLPHVADEIHHAERTRAGWMRAHAVGTAHRAAFVGRWYRCGVPLVAPRIDAAVAALRGVLPFPFMRQAFASPRCIGARVF